MSETVEPTFEEITAVAEDIATQVVDPNTTAISVEKAVKASGFDGDPKDLMESPKTQIIFQTLGLTTDFVVNALVEDIESKPQNRVQELKLAAQMLKLTDKQVTLTADAEITHAMDIISDLMNSQKEHVIEAEATTAEYTEVDNGVIADL